MYYAYVRASGGWPLNIQFFVFQINKGDINCSDPDFKLNIKISGDGAKMTRLTNFVVISFSILKNKKDVMSSKGND